MCRFALYLGVKTPISSLVTEPVNSIIHQSFHSHEREEPLNGDGFGIAWYPHAGDDQPALFKSTTPAWSNHNLLEIARVTSTRCLLAHVRAATPGLPVTELNCHPFASGRLTFMHNGDVGGFQALRRRLLASLSDAAFASIQGSTDSEHIFALVLDRLPSPKPEPVPVEQLAQALEGAIATVEALRREVAPAEPGFFNLVLCDGDQAAITRYASDDAETDSLYYSAGRTYLCEQRRCHMEETEGPPEAVIVASEPLNEDERWTPVEPGHMVLVTPERSVSTRPIDLSAPGQKA